MIGQTISYYRILKRLGEGGREQRRWVKQIPAMTAGLTDHCWTLKEMLTYRVSDVSAVVVPSKQVKTVVFSRAA